MDPTKYCIPYRQQSILVNDCEVREYLNKSEKECTSDILPTILFLVCNLYLKIEKYMTLDSLSTI